MGIRFGLIGCGYISRKHIKAIASCEEAILAAVSDLNGERMEEAKFYYQAELDQDHSIKCYEDYKEMLKDDQIDAVVISSFSGLHAEMAKAALYSGKHVVLEKPMALSIEESNQLIELEENQKKVLMVCHQLRFMPIMQTVKKLIDEGRLGKLFLCVSSIRINRSPDYYSKASWRGKWESDGGMLVNQGIHVVDLIQWFFGEVESVYGEVIQQPSQLKETEDAAVGIIRFSNQAKGIIEANIVTQPTNLGYSLTIFGEKGTISIEGPSLNRVSRWFIEGEQLSQEELSQLLSDRNEEIYMYENFLHAISTDSPVLIDGTEGKKALEIIFGLYKSELTKQVVHFPLDSFSTTEMKRKEGEKA